jgi:hypothetical protein
MARVTAFDITVIDLCDLGPVRIAIDPEDFS